MANVHIQAQEKVTLMTYSNFSIMGALIHPKFHHLIPHLSLHLQSTSVFIQLSSYLTKICHFNRDNSKC